MQLMWITNIVTATL